MKETLANCVDRDQMPQNIASDQSFHCLPEICTPDSSHIEMVIDLDRRVCMAVMGSYEPHYKKTIIRGF